MNGTRLRAVFVPKPKDHGGGKGISSKLGFGVIAPPPAFPGTVKGCTIEGGAPPAPASLGIGIPRPPSFIAPAPGTAG
jgi:hypothetical protein